VLEDEVNQDLQNPMKVLPYVKRTQQGEKKSQSPRGKSQSSGNQVT